MIRRRCAGVRVSTMGSNRNAQRRPKPLKRKRIDIAFEKVGELLRAPNIDGKQRGAVPLNRHPEEDCIKLARMNGDQLIGPNRWSLKVLHEQSVQHDGKARDNVVLEPLDALSSISVFWPRALLNGMPKVLPSIAVALYSAMLCAE